MKHKFNFGRVNYKDCGVIAFVGRSGSLSLGLLLALTESTCCPHLREEKKCMLDTHTLNFKKWNSHSRSECFIHTEPPYFFRNSRTCEALLTDLYNSQRAHTHTHSHQSLSGAPQRVARNLLQASGRGWQTKQSAIPTEILQQTAPTRLN